MSSITDLSLDGYPLLQTKSAVIPEVMTIFRETDRRRFLRKLSERNVLIWGEPSAHNTEETEVAVQYISEASKVADRLNVMGFTMRGVRDSFASARLLALDRAKSHLTDHELFRDEARLLQDLTFDTYAAALHTIIDTRLQPPPLGDPNRDTSDPVVRYVLSHFDDHIFEFLSTDVRVFVRLACDLVAPHSPIVQDLTDLVGGGYYDEDEPVCDNAIRELTSHPESSPYIILTEGSTDIAILRRALDLLYPHLAGYYTFFDFRASNARGGAAQLAAVVKAFVAAGIANRVIALFDNDTAARDGRRSLDSVHLPPNIVVLHYPYLNVLRDYPTVGPSGPSTMDINGLAASIELYLGEDVLSMHGDRVPIHWKSFNEGIGAYHGEVMKKAQLLSAFERKVERCKGSTAEMEAADWTGLRSILQAVFSSFN